VAVVVWNTDLFEEVIAEIVHLVWNQKVITVITRAHHMALF
jgi:hypothetical protein